MVSNNKQTSPREKQFIRFLNTVRKIGNEPAIDELDDMLSELVPPVRADAVEPGHDEANEFHEP
jgi:hypothetical protein